MFMRIVRIHDSFLVLTINCGCELQLRRDTESQEKERPIKNFQ
jgi:hypothetical protein